MRHIKESEMQETNGVTENTTIEIPILSSDAGMYELLTFLQEFTQGDSGLDNGSRTIPEIRNSPSRISLPVVVRRS
jgi:hypothetical protein